MIKQSFTIDEVIQRLSRPENDTLGDLLVTLQLAKHEEATIVELRTDSSTDKFREILRLLKGAFMSNTSPAYVMSEARYATLIEILSKELQ